jgi:hypothetical protein
VRLRPDWFGDANCFGWREHSHKVQQHGIVVAARVAKDADCATTARLVHRTLDCDGVRTATVSRGRCGRADEGDRRRESGNELPGQPQADDVDTHPRRHRSAIFDWDEVGSQLDDVPFAVENAPVLLVPHRPHRIEARRPSRRNCGFGGRKPRECDAIQR